MSIAPPSDIIMDVAQAADPLKLQAATVKLAKAAAGEGAPASFEAALGSASASPIGGMARSATFGALPGSFSINGAAAHAPVDPKQATADRKFEAMVLQSFVENIMPKNSELFGDAASADMGRTLLSEQIANQLAKSGRIGIAKSLERGGSGAAATAAAAQAAAPAVPPAPSTPRA